MVGLSNVCSLHLAAQLAAPFLAPAAIAHLVAQCYTSYGGVLGCVGTEVQLTELREAVVLADTRLNTFVATVGNMAERATTPNQAVPAAWMWRLKQPERDGGALQPGTASTVRPLPCWPLAVSDSPRCSPWHACVCP